MPTLDRAPARRRSKRTLAVRTLAAQVAWLDSPPRWREGCAVWTVAHDHAVKIMAPGGAEVAAAQRTLNRIARYPRALDAAFGDGATWLRERRERLEAARRLRAVAASDLPALARESRSRNPAAARRLAELLCAEAWCVDGLPVQPSVALARGGNVAAAALRDFLQDAAAPLPARALAALAAGAIWREHGSSAASGPVVVAPHEAPTEPWLRRAFRYGAQEGLPADPALAAWLLAEEDGLALAQRQTQSGGTAARCGVTAELLRELLAQGHTPERVVALSEAAANLEPLRHGFLRDEAAHAAALPPHSRARTVFLRHLRQERARWQADFAEAVGDYARATGDPQTLEHLHAFVAAMDEVKGAAWAWLGHVRQGIEPFVGLRLEAALGRETVYFLGDGRKLPPQLRGPFLSLLVEARAQLWNLDGMAKPRLARTAVGWLEKWLKRRWPGHVQPLLELLRNSGSEQIVRDALALGLHRQLARFEWRDPEFYRWALALAPRLLPSPKHKAREQFSKLCWALDHFTSAQEARAALGPLLDTVRGETTERQELFFFEVIEEFTTRRDWRVLLPRMAPLWPHVLGYLQRTEQEGSLYAVIRAAQVLDETLRHDRPAPEATTPDASAPPDDASAPPDEAPDASDEPAPVAAWLNRLIAALLTAQSQQKDIEYWRLGLKTRLATVLAAGDFDAFGRLLDALLCRPLDENETALERGLHLLWLYPRLGAPLAATLPREPERCLTLLVRLGLVLRLGNDVLRPLDAFKAVPADAILEDTLPPEWASLVEIAPALAPLAGRFLHAQSLLGGALAMPPGVRHALELRDKLAREAAHLETLAQAQPERGDLALRLAALRRRLADEAGLRHTVTEETGERLAQITTQVEIAAAEAQVAACYRARLAAVAGPLPEGLAMTADLFNAALLSVDIESNRKLLRDLLRAWLRGERDWREKRPANAAFLRELAGRGVDTTDWLAAHPRRYRCASGSRVHLHLERDPLHILQMGNYFDTCLSFGGCNSFSTVANACEMNKRVIYARDATGRVVGRKLIGLTADGQLIGFRTYTALTDEAANAELRAIFTAYATTFAARCGLTLAGDGTIPTLLAEEWYDDGAVPWHDQSAPRRSSRHP